MSDEGPHVCLTCKAEISWSEWSRARVDESLVREKAEIRVGRCQCHGKTYIQTRPTPSADDRDPG